MTYFEELEQMSNEERAELIGMENTNSARIMRAGILAGAIKDLELWAYLRFGVMPAVHTFDVWQKQGRAVRRGEHKAFDAVIWIPRTGRTQDAETDAETETETDADETRDYTRFIQKKSYFFRREQTDEINYPEIELPADVMREVRRGVEYLTGNTRPIKDALKEANYKWSRKKSAWYRPAQG